MRLGKIRWEKGGMSRNAEGLQEGIDQIRALREEFYADVRVPGVANGVNQELEKAGRVADLMELGELMCKDALQRTESCGGHFREESVELDGEQKGEALRDDENFSFVSAWQWNGESGNQELVKEQLEFKDIAVKQRSYK